jgi:hypothetical protein
LNGVDLIRYKYFRRLKQFVGSRFYINPDTNPRKSILVAGTARSGTTWLGDLIASQIPCRILFEPFNPELVPEYHGYHYFQYLRPDTENPDFHAFAQKIFKGEIRNRWINHKNERIFSEYRLIKEIRANLVLGWLHNHFPDVSIIFLMRHPCAVVLSRMELDWDTNRDIEPFLAQPNLIADFLSPYLSLIKNVKTDEEKHAIIWSVSNLVPLKQFPKNELKMVYYEDLCTHPEREIGAIFESIGIKISEFCFDKLNRPSQTTRSNSAVMSGANKLSDWQKKLSISQIKNILQVVSDFGLGNFYDESHLPLKE